MLDTFEYRSWYHRANSSGPRQVHESQCYFEASCILNRSRAQYFAFYLIKLWWCWCDVASGAVPPLVLLASANETDTEVKNEACWVVLNATSCGSDLQIEYLVQQGCIAILGELLGETSMVMMALEGLERILQVCLPRATN